MRPEIDPGTIDAIIGELETACGAVIPADKRQTVARRVGELMSISARGVLPSEQRQVSILLSDLRGFTALSQQYSAVDVVELLNRYLSRMCEVIARYGGTIDKFMGDGIMVLFGAPAGSHDDLERAIACATQMQQEMSEVNAENSRLGMPQLFMGIGINTGTVVAGNIGSDLHREYTVIGDHVNLASRIEVHSMRGQILLSEHSYRLASSYIDVGDAREVFVKGRRERVRLYELRGTRLPHPMQVPVRETRKSPRVPTDMPIVFQVVDGKRVLPALYRGRITDISYTGMRVMLKEPMLQHTEIKCSLALSLLSPEVTEIYGRVLQVAEHPGEYECSMEFSSIDPGGEEALHRFVDRSIG